MSKDFLPIITRINELYEKYKIPEFRYYPAISFIEKNEDGKEKLVLICLISAYPYPENHRPKIDDEHTEHYSFVGEYIDEEWYLHELNLIQLFASAEEIVRIKKETLHFKLLSCFKKK